MSAGDAARTRRVIVVAGVVLLAAIVVAVALSRDSDDDGPTPRPSVGWQTSEGQPACVYDPEDRTVDCTIGVEGNADGDDKATATFTVTAYADENTSKEVGSSSESVDVEGSEFRSVVVTIPVEKAPHVDEDGETACRLSVTY